MSYAVAYIYDITCAGRDIDTLTQAWIRANALNATDFRVSSSLLRKTSELRDTSDEHIFQDMSQDLELDQNRKILTEYITYYSLGA